MEVHAHTHTSRKKWTHYLWEFLMLFLAVFCGFLAEYQLEHTIEKNREVQYIRSFIEDLEADTATLQDRIDFCELTINRVDSLVILLNLPDRQKAAGDIYYFLRWMHRSDFFTINDRTIIQLRNAGGMRLISHKSVSDSIITYYRRVEAIEKLYEEQLTYRRSLRPVLGEILDGNDYTAVVDESSNVIRPSTPLKLRANDPGTINNVLIILQNLKGINITLRNSMHRLQARAIAMRTAIKNEYHLK